MTSIYDFTMDDIDGNPVDFDSYKGKTLLIVNTASKCGFTPQFEGLEKLYETYKTKDFVILGFPCNQFLMQDSKDNQTIHEFCQKNYGVDFPMFSKIKVNGKHAAPLYQYLAEETGGHSIKWNFTKFLISDEGEIIQRFEPKETPAEIQPVLEKTLA